jgi:uncharacterized protein YabN with tetrapyrrole methylase and pyrophosphatase domain
MVNKKKNSKKKISKKSVKKSNNKSIKTTIKPQKNNFTKFFMKILSIAILIYSIFHTIRIDPIEGLSILSALILVWIMIFVINKVRDGK